MCTSYYIVVHTSRKEDVERNNKNNNRKIKRIDIRLTEKEHQELLEKAKTNNMNISEYLISLIKKDNLKK